MFLSALIIRRMWGVGSNNWDLGIFTQATHNLGRGDFFMTYRGMDILGHHANFGLFALAPVSWLGGGATALSVIQAWALVLGAWPAFLLGRDRIASDADGPLKARLGLVMAVVWLLHPTVTGLTWWMFHPESLAFAAILGAWWAACRGKWALYAALVVWVVLQREDLPLAMAVFGGTVFLVHRMNGRARRAGVVTAVACGVFWLFLTQIFMPGRIGTDEPYYVKDFWGHLGTTMPEVILNAVSDPGRALQYSSAKERTEFVLSLSLPTGGTALLSPLALAPAVPQLAAVAMSNDDDSRQVWHHHGALYLAFSVIGSVETLRWIRRRKPQVVRVMAGVAVSGSILSYLVMAPTPIGVQSNRWGGATAASAAMHDVLATIPPDASIAASVTPGNALTNRSQIWVWPNPWMKWKRGYEFEPMPDPRVVEYIVVLRSELSPRTSGLLARLTDENGPYRVLADSDGTVLAQRRR
jgi:uncharacterized membrane protein